MPLPPSLVRPQRLHLRRRLLFSRPAVYFSRAAIYFSRPAVYCTRPAIYCTRAAVNRSRANVNPTCGAVGYFLVSVRCFSEEKVWSAVSVGNSAVSVLYLHRRDNDCTLAAIYCACAADNCTQQQNENLQSNSTKQSFNNF
jgi:hypothetical protein